jgi:hypothetical protein
MVRGLGKCAGRHAHRHAESTKAGNGAAGGDESSSRKRILSRQAVRDINVMFRAEKIRGWFLSVGTAPVVI